jgi:hypothetical protein
MPESQMPSGTQPSGQVPEVVEWDPESQVHWIESPAWIVLVAVPLTESRKTFESSPCSPFPTDTIRGAAGVGVGPVAGVGVGVGPVIVLSHAMATTQSNRKNVARAARKPGAMPRTLTRADGTYNPRPP